MQRWLKRITPDRDSLEKLWFLRPFTAIVMNRSCWNFNRSSVTRAFALGLFIAFVPPTPLFPLHLILCSIIGVMFSLNLPVLFTTVFVSNPLTWLPQILGSIWVGAMLMGRDLMPVIEHVNHHNMGRMLSQLWAPLLLGALFLGAVSAAIGYVLAQLLWRLRVIYLLKQRRARLGVRRSALGENTVD
jgi:uncharacterized protein (DUF2062 family)